MTGSTIDHLIAVTSFLAAFLLFITLFSQTIQTAILYQRHRQIALKCSDLLDNMLLNPGYPEDWGRSNITPSGFGLQDPEFVRYQLSPFSLMRLLSSTGEPVYYPKTDLWYSNVTIGFGNFLLVPYTQAINQTLVSKLLGINGTYGFQLTITPVITVSVSEIQPKNPLKFVVNVAGTGFPLANAAISYCLLRVWKGSGPYPAYTVRSGSTSTDHTGSAILEFSDIDGTADSYALIAYAHLCGLIGVGYHEHVSSTTQYIIPFIDNLADRTVLIAHSYDVHYYGPPVAELSYNATFVVLTEDFKLREIPIENSTGKIGKVNYGEGKPYGIVTIPTYNPGILIITYRKSATEYGVVLMPWGLSSLAFPVVFGGDPSGNEWVVTDTRQVVVNGIAYQVKLALWRMQDFPVFNPFWIGRKEPDTP